MTNKDKFLNNNVSAYEFACAFNLWCFNNKGLGGSQSDKMMIFLKQEAKPTLTEDERVILRNIENVGFNDIIGRSKEDGKLYLKGTAEMRAFAVNTMYGHLFQFIKNGEEYEIAELLKGE